MRFFYYFRHDERLVAKLRKPPRWKEKAVPPPLPTQQFGVSLQFIKDNHQGEVIPPIVRQCVEFLESPDGKEWLIYPFISK